MALLCFPEAKEAPNCTALLAFDLCTVELSRLCLFVGYNTRSSQRAESARCCRCSELGCLDSEPVSAAELLSETWSSFASP